MSRPEEQEELSAGSSPADAFDADYKQYHACVWPHDYCPDCGRSDCTPDPYDGSCRSRLPDPSEEGPPWDPLNLNRFFPDRCRLEEVKPEQRYGLLVVILILLGATVVLLALSFW